MEVLTGTKRQITLMQWNEELQKAKKRLAESEECYKRYGDSDALEWIKEDKAKVAEIERHIKEVVKYMDAHDIK